MTEEAALRAAIAAEPDDDTPRLVYADWLEENGRAEEAAFIRVECRLAATAPDDPEYTDLLDRRDELQIWLAAHAPRPELKFPAGLTVDSGRSWWTSTFRGFPRFLQFEGYEYRGLKPMRALAAAIEKAFARLPTRWLVVRFITVDQLVELLKQPVVAGLDHITVQLRVTDAERDEACRVIADCSRFGNLRGARLFFPIGEAGAAALARSGHFGRLESLSIEGSELTALALRALTAAAWLRGLRLLNVSELSESAFEELGRAEPFPRLHTLELDEASCSRTAALAFGRSKTFPALTALALTRCDLGDGRMAALFGGAGFHLASLKLSATTVGTDGAAALASVPWLGSLRRLTLAFSGLGPAGVAAIAGSKKLTGLQHLDLSYSTPGVAGLRAIANNPALRGLTTLCVNGPPTPNRNLTSSHFEQFLRTLDLPRLRCLDLSGRPVSKKTAAVMAGEKFAALTRLRLDGCQLTDAAASILLAAPALQHLLELTLADNGLSDSLKPLADPEIMPRLSAGSVFRNRISPPLVRKLRRRAGLIE